MRVDCWKLYWVFCSSLWIFRDWLSTNCGNLCFDNIILSYHRNPPAFFFLRPVLQSLKYCVWAFQSVYTAIYVCVLLVWKKDRTIYSRLNNLVFQREAFSWGFQPYFVYILVNRQVHLGLGWSNWMGCRHRFFSWSSFGGQKWLYFMVISTDRWVLYFWNVTNRKDWLFWFCLNGSIVVGSTILSQLVYSMFFVLSIRFCFVWRSYQSKGMLVIYRDVCNLEGCLLTASWIVFLWWCTSRWRCGWVFWLELLPDYLWIRILIQSFMVSLWLSSFISIVLLLTKRSNTNELNLYLAGCIKKIHNIFYLIVLPFNHTNKWFLKL